MNINKHTYDSTDSSGTPGNVTINKPSGKAALSIVLCALQFNDATLTFIKGVIPAAGSFTITGNANATAATKFGFVVFN